MTGMYERLRNATVAVPRTRTGSDEDRVSGLEKLALATAGGSVLDVGCNDGIVDTFFAGHHAVQCVGVDFYRPGLEACRLAAESWPATQGRFHDVDLTEGDAALAAALGEAHQTFTTVLYLGVHHHLRRQMPEGEAERFVVDLIARSQRYFAIRAASSDLQELSPRIEKAGLRLWYGDRTAMPRVNPLVVFERTVYTA